MQLRYIVSLEDFQEANRLMCKRSRHRTLILFLAVTVVIGILAVIGSWRAITNDSAQLIPVLTPVFFLLLFYIAFYFLLPVIAHWQARGRYRKVKPEQWMVTAEITQDHYDAKDEAGTKSSTPWSRYDSLLEGKRVFLLGSPLKVFAIISKSSMDSEQQGLVRTLLKAAIADSKA